jgi:hypothetical protein
VAECQRAECHREPEPESAFCELHVDGLQPWELRIIVSDGDGGASGLL